jgi:phosphotransferase family enzyme
MHKEDMIHRDLALRIERLIGARVESYTPVACGYTPATRLLCRTTTTSFFAKIGATPLTSQFLRREMHVYNSVSGAFMPQLVAWEDHESAPILVIEDLSAAHWPPPWDERRVELVLAQIHAMHHTQVSLASYAQVHGVRRANWPAVAADPVPFLSLGLADARWLDAALPLLIRHEAQCSTDGESLTHWDLRSDNICVTERRALFVDWNYACVSNPQLDLGFWLPSLAYEGGPEPERILPDAPEIATYVAGFFAARAGLPGISDAPRVRVVQRQQLETALPWVARALDLPLPGRRQCV